MTTKKLMLYMLLGVTLLFGALFGFKMLKGYLQWQAMSKMGNATVTVTTLKVAYQDWQPVTKAVGTLRAIQGTDITTQTDGVLQNLYFKPGSLVKAGDLLAALNRDSDTAHLQALEATVELANSVYKRDKAQITIKAISQATLDADLADLKNKTAQVTEQNALIAKKMIRAPFTGYLGIAYISIGQYLNTGDKIVTLQALDPIYVDFYLPQQALSYVAIDQTISLKTDTYPDQVFTGKLTTINPIIDISNRNVQLEATISNPAHKLLPGMFATLELLTGKTQRYLTIPQTAVTFNPFGEVIFTAVPKKNAKGTEIGLIAKQSFITTGDKRGDQIAVISGLTEGETLVTSGQIKLKNGSAISVNNTIVPANLSKPEVTEE